MDQLKALKYFVKAVELNSFTKAAKFFAVPASSLSRRISDLEKSLGASLLTRTTRVMKLTEIGQEYYNQVCDVLINLEHSNEVVRTYQAQPKGTLHISAMAGFGELILLPLLDEFTALYPEVILNVHLTDTLVTLGTDEVDIAIRSGYSPNDRVVVKTLMDNQFIPAAADSYLQQYGTPKHPFDLRQHKGLYYRTPTGPSSWMCEIDGQWHDVSGSLVATTNGGKWLVDKAVKGEGIVMLPRWVLDPYLRSGALKELHIDPPVTARQSPLSGIYLLYQKQRYHVPKIKAAVDFLVERMKDRN